MLVSAISTFILPGLELLGLDSGKLQDFATLGGKAALRGLLKHFRDPTRLLPSALARSHERAWLALEFALEEKTGGLMTDKETKVIRAALAELLDSPQLGYNSLDPATRRACANEIRSCRDQGFLDPRAFANGDEAAALPALERLLPGADQASLARTLLSGLPEFLRLHKFTQLATLMDRETGAGHSLLTAASDYFFRAEIRLSRELEIELTQTKLDAILRETREDRETNAQFREEVLGTLRDLHLDKQIRVRDGFSLRNDRERQMVRVLLDRLRTLPEGALDAGLLNDAGVLAFALGAPKEADDLFQRASEAPALPANGDADTQVAENRERARAHYNALRAALDDATRDRRDEALDHLKQAAILDPLHFGILPDKFIPEAVLGGGGFGMAILCKRKLAPKAASVVVKVLWPEEQERPAAELFTEAEILLGLDHPNIVRLLDCGYANGERWPYLLMDYFPDSLTLEQWVKQHGPLTPTDTRAVAILAAEGLGAAHDKDVLHRDVKPANLLIRRQITCWQVKVLDFGLACHAAEGRSMTSRQSQQSVRAQTLVGTLKYAAPEQLGDITAPITPAADIYGLARTLCFALSGKPEFSRNDWKNLENTDTDLAELLSQSLEEQPSERPQGVATFLSPLGKDAPPPNPSDKSHSSPISHRSHQDDDARLKHEISARLDREERERAIEEQVRRERQEKAEAERKERERAAAEQAAEESRRKEEIARREREQKEKAEADRKERERVAVEQAAAKAKVEADRLARLVSSPLDFTLPSIQTTKTETRMRKVSTHFGIFSKEVEETVEVPVTLSSVNLRLLPIPAGEFIMGSPTGEVDRGSDESQVLVTINKPFWLAETQFTQAQWQALMGKNPSRFIGMNLPVETVSWDDCVTCLAKLNKMFKGKLPVDFRFSLPTEAQWEYACRAGTNTPFHYGNKLDASMANFDGNYPYGGAPKGEYRQKTTPVKSFQKNAWGLYDMHGNVWEWCADWYYGTLAGGNIIIGPTGGTSRVFRGGSWDYGGGCCLSADRNRNTPDDRNQNLGFRPALIMA